MDAERIEITSNGLFALLREDFAEMMTAPTEASRIAGGTKVLRRVRQINRVADTVAGNPTAELAHAVERLGEVLLSQAEHRQNERLGLAFNRRSHSGSLFTSAAS